MLKKEKNSDCAGRGRNGRPKTTGRRMVEIEWNAAEWNTGPQHAMQLQTALNGGKMFEPCVLHGIEIFKIKEKWKRKRVNTLC